MPLDLKNNSYQQKINKIVTFKRNFLKLYRQGIAHPNEIHNNDDSIFDRLFDLQKYSKIESQDDPSIKLDLAIILVIAVKTTSRNPQTTMIAPSFLISHGQLSLAKKYTKTYRQDGHALLLKIPRESYSQKIVENMSESIFELTLAEKNHPEHNNYKMTKKILDRLTKPGPLSEIANVVISQNMPNTDLVENMPLTKQILRDVLYDNGIENHVPNLHDVFDSLLLLLIHAGISE